MHPYRGGVFGGFLAHAWNVFIMLALAAALNHAFLGSILLLCFGSNVSLGSCPFWDLLNDAVALPYRLALPCHEALRLTHRAWVRVAGIMWILTK